MFDHSGIKLTYISSEFILLFMFTRMWFNNLGNFSKFFKSEYDDIYSRKLCNSNGFDPETSFFKIKINFNKSPKYFIFAMIFWTILYCSTYMSIFERPYRFNDSTLEETVIGFWSSVWLTIITITSVGYGDIYPHSWFGKMLGMVMAIGGAFIVSLLVSVNQLIFKLNKDEVQAYEKIHLDRSAALSIMYALKFYSSKKKILQIDLQSQLQIITKEQMI